jgi:hypothetical protein
MALGQSEENNHVTWSQIQQLIQKLDSWEDKQSISCTFSYKYGTTNLAGLKITTDSWLIAFNFG